MVVLFQLAEIFFHNHHHHYDCLNRFQTSTCFYLSHSSFALLRGKRNEVSDTFKCYNLTS